MNAYQQSQSPVSANTVVAHDFSSSEIDTLFFTEFSAD